MEIVAWPWQFINGKHNNMQSMCNEWCAHRQKDGLRFKVGIYMWPTKEKVANGTHWRRNCKTIICKTIFFYIYKQFFIISSTIGHPSWTWWWFHPVNVMQIDYSCYIFYNSSNPTYFSYQSCWKNIHCGGKNFKSSMAVVLTSFRYPLNNSENQLINDFHPWGTCISFKIWPSSLLLLRLIWS